MLGIMLHSEVAVVNNPAIQQCLAFWSCEYGRENRLQMNEKQINIETPITNVLKIMVRDPDRES